MSDIAAQSSEAFARVDFARRALAPAVQELTLRWYQSPDLRHERKSDGSVVTPADREAEDTLRQLIAREFPADGVLGEERGETPGRPGNAWRWVLDPIDGTSSFVRGLPHWVLLIGIEHDLRPVAGLIDAPAVGETVWASIDRGAQWTLRKGDTRSAHVSSEADLSRALIELAPAQSFARDRRLDVHARLCAATRRIRGWSDGYAFALVATGRVDAAINFGFHRWDISACAAVIEQAGGRLTDWQGRASPDATDVIASNGRVHEALLTAVRVR